MMTLQELNDIKDMDIFQSQELFKYIIEKLSELETTDINTISSNIEFLYKLMRVTTEDELEQLRQDEWLSKTDNKENCEKLLEFATDYIGKPMIPSLRDKCEIIPTSNNTDRWGEPLNEEKAPLTMDAAVQYIIEHKSEMTESYSERLKEVITPLTMDAAVQYIKEHESEMTERYSEDLYKEIKVFVLERLVKMYELQ